MNIMKKFKELKINWFVNKCKEDGLNYEEYLPKLYNIDNFSKLVTKINRLDPKEKEYVLSPLRSMKYGLKEDEVYMIMKNHLDIVKKKHESNIVDLSKLYLATSKISKSIYQELVEKYLNEKTIGEYQAKNYIDMLTENPFSFMLNQPINSNVSLDGLAPNKLKQALNYNEYGPQFLNVYNSLSQKEKCDINNMDEVEFQKVLDFIFADYNFYSRKNLLAECGCISKKIDSLRLLPDYLIGLLYVNSQRNSAKEKYPINSYDFIKNIDNDSANWIAQLAATPEVHTHCIKALISTKNILKISNENLEEIFKSVRKNGEVDETNVDRYSSKMDFLIGSSDDKEGFALYTEDKEILKETLNFICQDDSELVLNQKFNALNTIKNELRNDQINSVLYSKYISLLNEGLENKSDKDKVKQLKARSKYFENHILSEFAQKLQIKPQNEKLIKLLQSDQKPKKMIQNYKFISMADNYEAKIANIVVNFLAETEDVHSSKILLSYIKSKQFKSLSPKKQKKRLTVLIDILKSEKKEKKKKSAKSLKK